MKLDAGTIVDRYVVEELLGAGGTAMVYRVRHRQLGTSHALKVLTISSTAIRERMLREGRVQATLNHVNVVAVTDVVDLDGTPGLLMEYIEGPSLERALGRYKLALDDAELLFHGILSGVQAAHEQGLVHRDLKPANVLLQRTRQGFVPKVTDFGLAKALEGDGDVAHTRSGIAMGTPSYMAPEQIRDARSVDQRADLWSLGCLLYELTTRRRTFPGDEALVIYNAVTQGQFEPPRKLIPDLPKRIEEAIHGCLRVDRDDRIPDTATLERVLQGEERWPLPDDLTDPAGLTEIDRADPMNSNVPTMAVAADPVQATEEVERAAVQAASAPTAVTTPRPLRRGLDSGTSSAGGGLEEITAEPRPPVPDLPRFDDEDAHQAETVIVSQGPVDGTLAPIDSLDDDDGLGWMPWVGAAFGALVVGALLLLLFATVVGGVAFTQRSGQSTEPVEAPASPPRPTVPAPTPVAPEPEAAEPEPEPEPEPRPRPSPRPEPAPAPRPEPAPAPRPDPAPAPAPAPAPTPAPAPAPAAPSRAPVKILSVPLTAQVFIDGKPSGRTPGSHTLTVGRHPVLMMLGGEEGQFVIDVSADGDNKWCFVFAEKRLVQGSCP